MILREFWRFHFLKALFGLVAVQLLVVAIIQNYNHKPVALRDEVSMIEGKMLKIKPLMNDTDKDENTSLVLSDFGEPNMGMVEQNKNSLTYTPNAGFVGVDSLFYTISDGEKVSHPSYILIHVMPNLPPVANADNAMVYCGNKVMINPILNDEDREGDSVFIADFSQAHHGNVMKVDGGFVYNAGANAVQDSFTYVLSDGKNYSEKASIIIDVKAKSDACYPWLYSDVGAVDLVGDLRCKSGELTIKASGSDIWGEQDGFYYAYQAILGDCEIVVKVNALEASNEWAKAGIMLRESLSAGAANFYVGIASKHGIGVQARFTELESTRGMGGNDTVNTPCWLKLNRKGNLLMGYSSVDGQAWEEIVKETIDFADDCYLGLCVTSHDNSILAEAVFSNITLKR